jgi:hypothetical protein
MIRISMKKGGLATVMNVDIVRTPYFFSDRDHVVVDSVKKRIFHVVQTHERDIGDGRSTYVRTHFRGLRRFTWNGYEITITAPGRDHNDWAHSDIAAIDSESEAGREEGKKLVKMAEVGRRIAQHMQPPEAHP